MENVLRVVEEAVETLEDYLQDAVDAIESPREKRQVALLINRVVKVINEAKKEL